MFSCASKIFWGITLLGLCSLSTATNSERFGFRNHLLPNLRPKREDILRGIPFKYSTDDWNRPVGSRFSSSLGRSTGGDYFRETSVNDGYARAFAGHIGSDQPLTASFRMRNVISDPRLSLSSKEFGSVPKHGSRMEGKPNWRAESIANFGSEPESHGVSKHTIPVTHESSPPRASFVGEPRQVVDTDIKQESREPERAATTATASPRPAEPVVSDPEWEAKKSNVSPEIEVPAREVETETQTETEENEVENSRDSNLFEDATCIMDKVLDICSAADFIVTQEMVKNNMAGLESMAPTADVQIDEIPGGASSPFADLEEACDCNSMVRVSMMYGSSSAEEAQVLNDNIDREMASAFLPGDMFPCIDTMMTEMEGPSCPSSPSKILSTEKEEAPEQSEAVTEDTSEEYSKDSKEENTETTPQVSSGPEQSSEQKSDEQNPQEPREQQSPTPTPPSTCNLKKRMKLCMTDASWIKKDFVSNEKEINQRLELPSSFSINDGFEVAVADPSLTKGCASKECCDCKEVGLVEISLEELEQKTAEAVMKNLDNYSDSIVDGTAFDSVTCGSHEDTIMKC